MTISEKKLAANRANAAKSTGPKTPAGKRNASRNNLRHGLLSGMVLIPGESAVRFAALVNSFIGSCQPETPIEMIEVEKLAAHQWRQQRIWALESVGIAHEMHHQPETLSGENAATRAMLAFRALNEKGVRHLDFTNRYECQYDRQFHRALHRLHFLQAERKNTEKNPEMPVQSQIPIENKGNSESFEPTERPLEPTV